MFATNSGTPAGSKVGSWVPKGKEVLLRQQDGTRLVGTLTVEGATPVRLLEFGWDAVMRDVGAFWFYESPNEQTKPASAPAPSQIGDKRQHKKKRSSIVYQHRRLLL